MEVTRVVLSEKKPRRRYDAPKIKSGDTGPSPIFLACTGRFDCEPLVGFPCCAADSQCIGC